MFINNFGWLWKKSKENKDRLVFRYNEHTNINTLDPAFSRTLQDTWVANQLFNGLVQMDSNLNIVPSIAKNWTISEDALTYTFLLRNDVYFQNIICLEKIRQDWLLPKILNLV